MAAGMQRRRRLVNRSSPRKLLVSAGNSSQSTCLWWCPERPRDVDKVRREQWHELQGTSEATAIKMSRWALLKNPWDLTRKQRRKLSEVQQNNRRLYRAYLLKEALAKTLDYRQPKRTTEALDEWLAWASRSRLKPFVTLARTIRKHKDGILAYIKDSRTASPTVSSKASTTASA